ncbi:putative immunity protein [Sphingomonas koreensis]
MTLPLTLDDLRHLARWAEGCAARALPVFEENVPGDPRPRDALVATLAFADGAERSAPLRKAAWAAQAAARGTSHPAAASAARAAAAAAGSAYTHPIATAHQLNHILAPAGYAAHALVLRSKDPARVEDLEIDSAIASAPTAVRRLIAQLPPRNSSRTALGRLFHRLETGLRR